ncbi:putative ferredoxin/ferredoxin--NADP reductase [Tsukamurella pulmonis]|uniref:FAD-dependent oxidoreductase n=1 Tax=Tsukamurella pulmonis TaxID=47312 RepID=UPI001EDF1F28|nr:FAD-dependent oxidoreductase [Tsukamurella pulmonis]BDD84775.1 putative ferredoxin/ferredoxin--NADP reductase [Tsukamurella pulmonis]
MSHLITQSCCNDAACVPACPVNCIHPTPEEPEFATAEMLYIDPATCIDCGACVPECPVDAIVPDTALTSANERFRGINAEYFRDHDVRAGVLPFRASEPPRVRESARVAVVGAGPAGLYTAQELLAEPNVEVDVIDRLPTPLGLIRAGVAPDHQATKKVGTALDAIARSPRFRYLLGVEVGRHVSPAELAEIYSAVVYAHGAADPKSLGIPGEDLPSSVSSTEFVAWYNGHPDYADRVFDLSGERAVVVGNGNVALDVARILLTDPDDLAKTDIADHALERLRESAVREVVLLGRRGPAEIACTIGELAALGSRSDIDFVIENTAPVEGGSAREIDGSRDADLHPKLTLLRALAADCDDGTRRRRIVFRFHSRPVTIQGTAEGGVTGIEVEDTAGTARSDTPKSDPVIIETPLVVRSIGYTGRPLAGLPFDTSRGVVPNHEGRVLDGASGAPLPGQYVAGWIKRGSQGGIGTNRRCGEETARSILSDLASDPRPAQQTDLVEIVAARDASVIDVRGWESIDSAERAEGATAGRPRVKITDRGALHAAADGRG